MFKLGIVSNVDFQRAGVNLQAAEARHQGAIEEVYRTQAELLQRRQEVELARQLLTDTVIRAPFSGAITERIAGLGEYLAVNAPVVVLVRSHPLRVRLQVPERQSFRIRIGQRIDLTFEGQAAPRPGRVIRISPAIEAQSRSLIIEGEMPNEDGRLRAGAFVEATLVVNPDARGLAVPRSSVLNFAGIDRMFVVKEGELAERIVRLGRRLGDDRVQVASGLEPGDTYVLEPSDRYIPGQKVRIEGSN
jgi:RND family efflux transporter MFP subunit